eukprot:TRINITY_DN8460_c0_g1_i1.p1 TRINITY_DN8460_c0_g1~~TRINITY_DN8460_c0_g1_i1.p1  ORF type:complete len:348 (-),score=120.43 TRINITY_DN8460_c0_g1_i1:9-1022(-)
MSVHFVPIACHDGQTVRVAVVGGMCEQSLARTLAQLLPNSAVADAVALRRSTSYWPLAAVCAAPTALLQECNGQPLEIVSAALLRAGSIDMPPPRDVPQATTGSSGGLELPTMTSHGSEAHAIELKELSIGTWSIKSRWKGELTLVIDEAKHVVQYRWRKPIKKRQVYVTYMIQFGIDELVSATTEESGKADSVSTDQPQATKRRRSDDDGAAATATAAEPTYSVAWLLELSGAPMFFKSDERPLKKTTERQKSLTASADIKVRRVDEPSAASPAFHASDDFSRDNQATTYRRHKCVAVDKSATRLVALLGDKPYLTRLAPIPMFAIPGSGMTFGHK